MSLMRPTSTSFKYGICLALEHPPLSSHLSEVVEVLLVGEEQDLVGAGEGAGLEDLAGARH